MKEGREDDLPNSVIKLQQAVLIASIKIVAALEGDERRDDAMNERDD